MVIKSTLWLNTELDEMEEFLEEFPTVDIDVNKTLEYSNDTDSKDRKFCYNTFSLQMINANYTIFSRQQRLCIFYSVETWSDTSRHMPSFAAFELSQQTDINKTLSQTPIMCYLSRPMCQILQLFFAKISFSNLCSRFFVSATQIFKYSKSASKCYFILIMLFLKI